MKTKLLIGLIALAVISGTTAYKSDFFEISKQLEIFTTMFKELNMNYVDETNPAQLMDKAIKEMLEDLDPYTRFLNEQDVETYKIKRTGEYSGIGAMVRTKKEKLVLLEVYKGYPADEAGMKAGDEIYQVGDIKVEEVKEDAGDLLKGEVGSEVELKFRRQGKKMSAFVTRDEIEIEAVPYYKLMDNNVGYVVLRKFNRKASYQVQEAVQELKSQGATSIILDLRGNPGGLLHESLKIVNFFVPKDLILVTTKSKIKKFNKIYKAKKEPLDLEIPLAVLINDRSASASEIVSGSFQDLDRAVIVGARSFGKGLVQRPMKLPYGTQLKVTISRYYTPSGRCIQAIDYANKNEEGKAVKKEASQFNEYRTTNGRKVYDSGGIEPDIVVDQLKKSELTKSLIYSELIFNFAVDRASKLTGASSAQFSFSESDYEAFKQYVKENEDKLISSNDKKLKTLLEKKEFQELGESIDDAYKTFIASVKQNKIAAMDRFKSEIVHNLVEEIVVKKYYRDGLYDYYIKNDEAIKEASAVLLDKKRYRKILKMK